MLSFIVNVQELISSLDNEHKYDNIAHRLQSSNNLQAVRNFDFKINIQTYGDMYSLLLDLL